jgi:hypothetical protein
VHGKLSLATSLWRQYDQWPAIPLTIYAMNAGARVKGAELSIVDRIRTARAISAMCLLALGWGLNASAKAEEDIIRSGEETFKINLGGIINNSNSSLRLDGSAGRSAEVDLENVAGLEDNFSSLLGAATWRFASKHRIGAEVFAIRRSASKTVNQTIQLGDTVIPAGTTVSAESKSQFFVTNYQYSFIKNSNLELAGLVGFYGARFKFNFDAPATHVDAHTTAPLPVLGASLAYFVSPRWTVSVFGEGLKMKIGDVEGRVYYAGVSTDYMITRHFGLGIGYSLADLKVDVDKGDFRGQVNWRMTSLFGYAQARF